MKSEVDYIPKQGCTNARLQIAMANNFVCRQHIFVGPQSDTSFMSQFWRMEF